MDGPNIDYPIYTSGYTSVSSVPVIFTDDSMEEEEIEDELGRNRERLTSEEDYVYSSSRNSSVNDISDEYRLNGAVSRGLRPPPQVVSAVSLPNLLMADQSDRMSSVVESSSGDMYTNSENNLQSWVRKESLLNTLSTADSKTSTLVESALVSFRYLLAFALMLVNKKGLRILVHCLIRNE